MRERRPNSREVSLQEIRDWLLETARDELLQLPPELPEIEAEVDVAAVAPAPIIMPASAPRRKAPHSELIIDQTTQLDGNLARRLRQGKIKINATIDLHGMHKAAAQDAVDAFVLLAAARGARLLLIITGKGGQAILRSALPHWLNMPHLRPLLLAAVTARNEDGGAGALYVLMKNNRHGRT